ncbi:glycosyltransferase family 2 protein [Paenibacillus harenae]|uniref:glycosyltransferase family 2 protein n=1 Tax=Paenibacillus harenae TaxID=306543 RepID=UPI00279038CF|nr:glycosyltransferase family A protein [Paenibacillus harenae]MDQ0058844.1 glycosyltransferase involved in cell wall biosynthesis [Paenibacillus harenae]
MVDVGIVMPVYTQDSAIFRKAIQSVLRQRYRQFQLVIVIDGVTPNVSRIARYFARKDSRVRVLPQLKNRGTAHALNIGFQFLTRQPRIKYLTWVSSDNIYYPRFVGALRNRLVNSTPDIGLAYSAFRLINRKGKVIHMPWMNNLHEFQNQPKEHLVDYYFIHYAFMYKKEYAQKIDGYQNTPVEDYDYFLRLTDHCNITYVPMTLMGFRLRSPHSNSLQIAQSNKKRRNRRYLMYSVMQQARLRRNILPDLTFILLVTDASQDTVQSLEKLLSQSYSNYKLLIYDLSATQSFLPVLYENPDTRVIYQSIPYGTIHNVAAQGLALTDTPLVIFYQPDPGLLHKDSVLDPNYLAESVSRYGVRAFRQDLGYTQIDETPPPPDQPVNWAEGPKLGQIYRTDAIKLSLNGIPAQM